MFESSINAMDWKVSQSNLYKVLINLLIESYLLKNFKLQIELYEWMKEEMIVAD